MTAYRPPPGGSAAAPETDVEAVVSILAALLQVPERQRLDVLATAIRVALDGGVVR